MTKAKATFYLPLHDNDGRSLQNERLAVEDELYGRFGGWTFFGYISGMYRMADGSQAFDRCAMYSLILDENRVSEVADILRKFRKSTLQESVYLEIQGGIDIRLIS